MRLSPLWAWLLNSLTDGFSREFLTLINSHTPSARGCITLLYLCINTICWCTSCSWSVVCLSLGYSTIIWHNLIFFSVPRLGTKCGCLGHTVASSFISLIGALIFLIHSLWLCLCGRGRGGFRELPLDLPHLNGS